MSCYLDDNPKTEVREYLKKNPQLTPQLKALYEEEFRRAADQDEDRASFRIQPNLRSYNNA